METAFIAGDVDEALSLAIRFERRQTETEPRSSRFYAMRIERDRQLMLDGRPEGFVLWVTRGRLGGPTISARPQRFRTLASLVERWGYLCARRRANGYREQQPA